MGEGERSDCAGSKDHCLSRERTYVIITKNSNSVNME